MKTQTLAKVTTGGARLRIRSGPGIKHDVIGYCRNGEEVKLAGSKKGMWMPIETRRGIAGWAVVSFLKAEDSARENRVSRQRALSAK